METTENTQTKRCTKCGRELPLSEFSKASKSKDGHFWYCKECQSKINKENWIKRRKARNTGIYPANFYDKNLSGGGNPQLADFTARELMEELRARGYRGQLEYTSKINIETI